MSSYKQLKEEIAALKELNNILVNEVEAAAISTVATTEEVNNYKDRIKHLEITIKSLEIQISNMTSYLEKKGISLKKFYYDKKYLEELKSL